METSELSVQEQIKILRARLKEVCRAITEQAKPKSLSSVDGDLTVEAQDDGIFIKKMFYSNEDSQIFIKDTQIKELINLLKLFVH
tara:strand:- start:1256 stop:1510 length:255 start_codon:yes stop_codon:yes gene_type:complete